jgi:HPt (histidine-containing phosphotransfer) domain-containing protein
VDDEVDLATIEDLRELEADGDSGFVREMVAIYASDSATKLQLLRAAVTDGDLARVGDLAHTLKGSSRSIGAARAGDAAQALEHHAVQPVEDEDPVQLLEVLEQAVERVLPRLEELAAGPVSARSTCR